MVPEQELHRPVEADMRQRQGFAVASELRDGRAEFEEAEISLVLRHGQRVAAKRQPRISGQFPGKIAPGHAVEGVETDPLASDGRPDDGRSVSPSCLTTASRVARTAANAITSILAPTPSARAMAREVKRRRMPSSLPWLV